MVTINFKEGVSLEIIKKKISKCLSKKWIVNFMYCYEWRLLDTGLHVHMKIEPLKSKKIYDCKREIYNTFKHIVGNKRCVCMRYSNKQGCFDNYILGFRDGKEKENYGNDEENRKRLGLQSVYKN